jgi:type IX secretion system PorP/SprF family membrane protein
LGLLNTRQPMQHSRLALLLFFGFTCALCTSVRAQDVHYTLHNYAPLWLNPANTGSFSGSIRAGGVYRGQWHSLNGIQSPSAYADAPLAFGFRKQDWVGVGFSLVSDQAGAFDIQSTFFGLSASYHLALDKKRQNVLTIGGQYGSQSYGIMPDGVPIQGLNIAEELGGQGQLGRSEFPTMSAMGPDGGRGNNNNFTDINAGVKLKLLMDEKKANVFEAGVALLHLNSGDRRSLVPTMQGDTTMMGEEGGSRDFDRRSTIHAHARLDMEISEKWRFQPTIFYQQSAGTSSVSLQAWGSRNLKKDLDLRLGLGYRTADAAKVMVGLDAGQLRGALSYDITLSQARQVTNFQGAFELGLAYIFNIYKKPEVTPTVLCPRI